MFRRLVLAASMALAVPAMAAESGGDHAVSADLASEPVPIEARVQELEQRLGVTVRQLEMPLRARPVRAAGWVLAEQGAIFFVDGWVARPQQWTDPQWSMFAQAFTRPPLMADEDGFITNVILHPVGGAHFYMAARNHGMTVTEAAVFSLASSVAWEFIIESWFTRPVLFDTFITPGLGVPIGIVFTKLKIPIRRIDSRVLRGVVMLPIDPLEGTDILLFGGPPYAAHY